MLDVHVQKELGDHRIDASFTAEAGITVLFGPSGAGKSSILSMISGLLTPDDGQICLTGRALYNGTTNLPPEKRRVGHVFQDGLLFPHLTVRQNLLFGAPSGESLAEIVALMGLNDLLDRRPRHLSGGETQRVAIARALLTRPELLLLDEPMASLDQALKDRLLPFLKQLRQRVGIPVLLVTHSVEEAFRLGDRIVLIDQGRIVDQGTPAEIFAPATMPRHPALPTGGILNGRIVRHHQDDLLSELDIAGTPVFVELLSQPPGSEVRLRLDGSDIAVGKGDSGDISILNRLPATVAVMDRSRTGHIRLHLTLLDGQRLAASVTSRAARNLQLDTGQQVLALFKAVSVTPGQLDQG